MISFLPLFIILTLISFLNSEVHNIIIDRHYYSRSTRTFELSNNSSIPFSVHLTTIAGNANCKGIFYDQNLTKPVPQTTMRILGNKLIMNAPYINTTIYYFQLRSANGYSFLQVRQLNNNSNIIQLTSNFTNFEYINSENVTIFKLPKRVYNVSHESEVYVQGMNCDLKLKDPNGNEYEKENFLKFKYYATDDKEFSFELLAQNIYPSSEKECGVMIDMSHYDYKSELVLFNLTVRTIYNFSLSDTKPFDFLFYIFPRSETRYVYLYIDNYNENSMKFACNLNEMGYHYSNGGALTTFRMPEMEERFLCRFLPNYESTNVYNFSLLLKEGHVFYPIYIKPNRLIREFTLVNEEKLYYTLIDNTFEGKIVINQKLNNRICVRIRTMEEVDTGMYWMGKFNSDMICLYGESINYDDHKTSVNIHKDMVSHCQNTCELHVIIENRVPSQYEYLGKHFYNEDLYIYLQQKGEVTQMNINEPIVGSFIENDETPLYYRVNIPFKIKEFFIYFERYKDNIELYIKQGYDKPTKDNYDWKIIRSIDSYIKINYNNTNDELGNFQYESFTLMVIIHKYEQYKSEFKIKFIPQYPYSPVQTSLVKLGDSNICEADENNLYCVFIVYIHERTALNGWFFYIDFPYDYTLTSDLIYVRTIKSELILPSLYSYLDNHIERLFPNDNTPNTIKLEKGKRAYYLNEDNISTSRVAFVKVNIPRAGIIKMYTTKYYSILKETNVTYFFDKQLVYVPHQERRSINFDLIEGMQMELKEVTGTHDINIDSMEPILETENSAIFEGNGKKNIITLNNNNDGNERGYYVTLYEEKLKQPDYMEFNQTNIIQLNNECIEGNIVNILPKGKDIFINFYINDTPRLTKTGNNETQSVIINAYILTKEQYQLLMQTPNIIPENSTKLHIEYDKKYDINNKHYAFVNFTSSTDFVNYLYINAMLTMNTTTIPINLSITKQTSNIASSFAVTTSQPFQGVTYKNTSLSELDLPVHQIHPLITSQISQYVIKINIHTSSIQKHISFINITEYPWTSDSLNKSWYIENMEVSSNEIVLHIVKYHPKEMAIVLGFVFGELDEIKYNIILMVKDAPFDYMILIPIGVGIVFGIITLVLFTILRQKKRKEGNILLNITDMGGIKVEDKNNINEYNDINEDNDIRKDDYVEKPNPEKKDLMEWG